MTFLLCLFWTIGIAIYFYCSVTWIFMALRNCCTEGKYIAEYITSARNCISIIPSLVHACIEICGSCMLKWRANLFYGWKDKWLDKNRLLWSMFFLQAIFVLHWCLLQSIYCHIPCEECPLLALCATLVTCHPRAKRILEDLNSTLRWIKWRII